jgi:hypothetical protein
MFTAQFDSRCGGCDERIHEGDTVGWVDGEVCCADCVDDNGGEN